jgi:hypothetical protein
MSSNDVNDIGMYAAALAMEASKLVGNELEIFCSQRKSFNFI